jgi:nitrogen fixation NifU-like protein|tara:strand:+ start:1237 stop:1635 length:399 start_codon:yes stop_codon:yes gene_type:complete
MIKDEIIKIALNTKNVGLTNKYNFKSNLKNSLCGDKIKLELTIKNSKINSMKYETESCVFCEASASLLATRIKNLDITTTINELNLLKRVGKSEKLNFPRHFKDFKILINKNTLKRINCINLPFDAVLKALK